LQCNVPRGATPGVYAVSLVSHAGEKMQDSSNGRHVVVTASKLLMDTASIRQVHNGIQEVRVVIQGVNERREVANGLDWLALSGACHKSTADHFTR
jgi:hypothetical protein